MAKSVLMIGLEPTLIDFSDPAFAASPDLDASKVQAGLDASQAELNALGYDAAWLLTDLGETAESVVRTRLTERSFDCVLVGAGIRAIPPYFLLFERLLNVVHEHAPRSRICFNTNPGDTAAAVQRWI